MIPTGIAHISNTCTSPVDEVEPTRIVARRRGSLVVRRATHRHSVRLLRDSAGREIPCVSIILTGPRVREWGFWCPGASLGLPRFVPWRQFGAGGCDETEARHTHEHSDSADAR